MADEPQPADRDVATVDIESLLAQAEKTITSIGAGPELRPFQLADFSGAELNARVNQFDSSGDVEREVTIEFGRTRMESDEVLRLRAGSIVALDQPAANPVDIVVEGRRIAKGELLVLNDNFCVRIVELCAGEAGG